MLFCCTLGETFQQQTELISMSIIHTTNILKCVSAFIIYQTYLDNSARSHESVAIVDDWFGALRFLLYWLLICQSIDLSEHHLRFLLWQNKLLHTRPVQISHLKYQVHNHKYRNTNIQIQKYKYINTNTEIQIHKYLNTKTVQIFHQISKQRRW